MILVGVGGDGQRVSLVLTGRDTQLAKEMEPLDAIRLAHRLLDEALRVHNKTPLAEAGGASKGVSNPKGYDAYIPEMPVNGNRVELTKTERVLLRMARLQAGIMSKQMACDLGVAPQRFSNYETGARTVPSQVLVAWRQALGRE